MTFFRTGHGLFQFGRPKRLDRHGILAFLRSVATDRGGMLELRRILADELHRTSIHNMRDELVIEQLADRYLRGSLTLVHVRPLDIGIELEGFLVEGADATPLTGPKNEAGDLRPAPEVPPEYPVLARVESDQIIDSTLKLVAKLGDLLFGAFGLQKRPSTLAKELVLLAAEEASGVKLANTKVDLDLGLQLHPQGKILLPDPQVKDAYVAAAAEIAAGPRPAAKGLIDLMWPLTRVDTNRRFDNPVGAGPVKSDQSDGKKGPEAALDWVEIELVDDGDPPKPYAGARYRIELEGGKVIEGTLDDDGKARVDGIPSGSGTVTFPDIDAGFWGTNGAGSAGAAAPPPPSSSSSSAVSADEAWVEIELVDDDDPPKPRAGARYRIELEGGKVVEGTLDDQGKARVDGIPSGSGTVTFPDIDGSTWGPGERGT
ncbi:hypothetical protein KEG38_23050 [Polyangium jinanense]|uniref:MSCRAMM family protein n=1 Tax=Polyangium jinanense TaxID=2829994 RepID=UPI0023423789|nr:hypothetical protein [Polyangium jinanense]MDC3956757.1 hypothetical protein [Polyangium jinanense]